VATDVVGVALDAHVLDLRMVGHDLGHLGEQAVAVLLDDGLAEVELRLLEDLDLRVLDEDARAAIDLRVLVLRSGGIGTGVDVVEDAVLAAVGVRTAVGPRVVGLDAGDIDAGVVLVEDAVAVAIGRATVGLRVVRADTKLVGVPLGPEPCPTIAVKRAIRPLSAFALTACAPFVAFDPALPAAANYGAIGAIIGHEISHSFDDQGALFDATGKLSNWWSADDLAHFKASGAALAKQYDAYKPFPDASVNGKQTLGENIADVAGLSTAFDAYQLSLGGKPAPQVEGFTGEQQFFLALAQSWRQKSREARVRSRLVTGGHAPAEYRADTVRNLDAWYAEFEPKPGQALFLAPSERVRAWCVIPSS